MRRRAADDLVDQRLQGWSASASPQKAITCRCWTVGPHRLALGLHHRPRPAHAARRPRPAGIAPPPAAPVIAARTYTLTSRVKAPRSHYLREWEALGTMATWQDAAKGRWLA